MEETKGGGEEGEEGEGNLLLLSGSKVIKKNERKLIVQHIVLCYLSFVKG